MNFKNDYRNTKKTSLRKHKLFCENADIYIALIAFIIYMLTLCGVGQ